MMPGTTSLPVLEHAASLIDCGLHVLLLRGKVPATEHGYLDATTDITSIEGWIAAAPDATNVGIAPGRSGLVVVDLDETKPVEKVPALIRLQQVAEQHGGVPETLTVRTGSGGRHLYFRGSSDRVLGQGNGVRNPDTGRTESGVDFRGVKGYVVAPPSVHPTTGKEYRWETPSGCHEPELIAPIPQWLIEFLEPPKVQLAAPGWEAPEVPASQVDQRRVAGMVERACDEISKLGEGMGRRTELQRAAYRLAGMCWTGYPVESLRGSLQSAAHACGHWDEDTRRTIDDAIRDGLAKPYPLPPDSPEYQSRQGWRSRMAAALRHWARAHRADDEEDDGHVVTDEERAMAIPLLLKVPAAKVWYLRCDSGYVVVDQALLRVEIERLHPDVETVVRGEDGVRPMGPATLFAHYGRRCDRVVYDMAAERTTYRVGPDGGGELVFRCCTPDPELVPKYDERIDRWLTYLAAAKYTRLLDYLACCMDLSRPIAALYLRGPGGAGKGMLAHGIARIWGTSRTAYESVVLGNWNSALLRQPLVYLDERAPHDPSGRGSAGFRSLVGDSERPLTEKYRTDATVRGCPRLFIAANDDDALRFGSEDLTRLDEEAIAVRILHIVVPEEAKQHLIDIGGREATHDWVETEDGRPGRIPCHVAWLVQNWEVQRPGSRFLVEGDPGDWIRGLGGKGGLPRAILIAILRAASGHDVAIKDRAAWPIVYHDRRALVLMEPFWAAWSILMPDAKPPTLNALSRAMGRISERRKASRAEHGARPWVYPFDGQQLVELADELGIGNPKAIANRLGLQYTGDADDD